MQLSLHADYACRVLIYLTAVPEASIPEIAKDYGVSYNHLVKVVHKLGQLGFIKTVRGKGGGIQLNKNPVEISLGEVIRKMEPHFDIVECFNSKTNTCKILPACRLNHALKEATQAFLKTLDRYTVEDFVANKALVKTIFLRSKKELKSL